MALVEPGVEVADDHGGAAAGDRVRLGRVDLPHVPLPRGERVQPSRCVRQVARRRVGGIADKRRDLRNRRSSMRRPTRSARRSQAPARTWRCRTRQSPRRSRRSRRRAARRPSRPSPAGRPRSTDPCRSGRMSPRQPDPLRPSSRRSRPRRPRSVRISSRDALPLSGALSQRVEPDPYRELREVEVERVQQLDRGFDVCTVTSPGTSRSASE